MTTAMMMRSTSPDRREKLKRCAPRRPVKQVGFFFCGGGTVEAMSSLAHPSRQSHAVRLSSSSDRSDRSARSSTLERVSGKGCSSKSATPPDAQRTPWLSQPAFFWTQAEVASSESTSSVWEEAAQDEATSDLGPPERLAGSVQVSREDLDALIQDGSLGEFLAVQDILERGQALRNRQRPAGHASHAPSLEDEEAFDFAFAQACGQLARQFRAERASQGLPETPYTPDRARIFQLARRLMRKA